MLNKFFINGVEGNFQILGAKSLTYFFNREGDLHTILICPPERGVDIEIMPEVVVQVKLLPVLTRILNENG